MSRNNQHTIAQQQEEKDKELFNKELAAMKQTPVEGSRVVGLEEGMEVGQVDFSSLFMSPAPTSEDFDSAQSILLSGNTTLAPKLDPKSQRYKNFSKMRFTLFYLPTFTIYLQGPSLFLPNEEELASNWRNYFTIPGLAKTKRSGVNGIVIPPHAQYLIEQVASSPLFQSKLYNDKDWHRNYIAALGETGLDFTVALAASGSLVQETIKDYWEGLNYWLSSNGFTSLDHWKSTQAGLATRDSKIQSRALLESFSNTDLTVEDLDL